MATRTLARDAAPFLAAYIQRETWGYESCLEFGSGRGAHTREILCPVAHGIEVFAPYVEEAKTALGSCEFFLGDMREFDSLVTREYDIAMFIDTLEHIPKADGLDLILRCQRKFKKIILFIPIGEKFQGNQDYYDGNPAQQHLASWELGDLESLGFYGTCNDTFHAHLPEGHQAAAFLVWSA